MVVGGTGERCGGVRSSDFPSSHSFGRRERVSWLGGHGALGLEDVFFRVGEVRMES